MKMKKSKTHRKSVHSSPDSSTSTLATVHKFDDLQMAMSENQNLLLLARGKEVTSVCLTTKQIVTSTAFPDNVLCLSLSKEVDENKGFVLTEREIVQVSLPFLKVISSTSISNYVKEVTSASFGSVLLNDLGKVDKMVIVDSASNTLWASDKKWKKSFFDIAHFNDQPLVSFNRDAFCFASTRDNMLIYTDGFGDGNRIFYRSRARAISCIRMCQNVEKRSLAFSDISGRIMIGHPNEKMDQLVVSQVHWHSKPVRALDWSEDGEHFFSGGGENVLIKWNVNTMSKEEIVPRIGAAINHISVSQTKVSVTLSDLTVKCFNQHLRMDTHLSPFMDVVSLRKSDVFWHEPTATIAYLKGGKDLNFHDPKQKRDIMTFDIGQRNVVTGEDWEIKDFRLTFRMSVSGTWMASFDEDSNLKIWHYSQVKKTFSMVSKILRCHDGDLADMKIAEKNDEAILITTSKEDKKLKIWKGEETEWNLMKTLTYKKKCPSLIAVSSDNSVLAVLFDDVITLWSLSTFQFRSAFSILNVKYLGFSQSLCNSNLFVANDNYVIVMNCISLEVVRTVKLACEKLTSIGDKLFAVTADQKVVELDRELQVNTLHKDIEALHVVGSAKVGALVVLKDGTVFQEKHEDMIKDLHLLRIQQEDKNKDIFASVKIGNNNSMNLLDSIDRMDNFYEVHLSNPLTQSLPRLLRDSI